MKKARRQGRESEKAREKFCGHKWRSKPAVGEGPAGGPAHTCSYCSRHILCVRACVRVCVRIYVCMYACMYINVCILVCMCV